MIRGVLLGWLALGCSAAPDPCANQQDRIWFEDADRDGLGNPSVAIFTCPDGLPSGWVEDATDCDDLRASVFPGAIELCDGLDNDCDRAVDEGLPSQDYYVDFDGDGFGLGSTRVAACSQPPDSSTLAGDCDDFDALAFPGAAEVCDGVDNNCDGLVDAADPTLDPSSGVSFFPDADGDGFGDGEDERFACSLPPGAVLDGSDCDDSSALVAPGEFEVCDGVDNDCDGLTDDSDPSLLQITQREWFADEDADGFGDPATGFFTCTEPWYHVLDGTDCDDTDPDIFGPSTTPWVWDGDGDGVGAGSASDPSCSAPEPGWVPASRGEDCDDTDPSRSPLQAEVCNGADDDCDGWVDLEDPDLDPGSTTAYLVDGDGDGFGGEPVFLCEPPDDVVFLGGDCDDADPFVFPGQTEYCNGGIDDDCNGYVDDEDPLVDLTGEAYFYVDLDEDGFGDPTSGDPFCVAPVGRVDNQMDCDDRFASVGPPSLWWSDLDGDGYGTGPTTGPTCFAPEPGQARVGLGEDCDDADPTLQPGAFDACGDGVDADCDGVDPFCPRPSCQALLDEGIDEDGVYSIDPGDGSGARLVVCDQSADGGGWTLVSSSNSPVDDELDGYSTQLTSLFPDAPMSGLWGGMRAEITGNSDIRFTCKEEPEDEEMTVDLVFYDIHWYRELTSGADEDVCFNEDDGAGYDLPAPARRNLLTGQFRARGNDWDAGYLEGEDQCESRDDFTVDFDDRGLDSNQYDGTDWGEDDDHIKCGVNNVGAAWFIWVR